jgi:hypothetical protein
VVSERDDPEWRDRELRHEHFKIKAFLQQSKSHFQFPWNSKLLDAVIRWGVRRFKALRSKGSSAVIERNEVMAECCRQNSRSVAVYLANLVLGRRCLLYSVQHLARNLTRSCKKNRRLLRLKYIFQVCPLQ